MHGMENVKFSWTTQKYSISILEFNNSVEQSTSLENNNCTANQEINLSL
jgi:hypothetical protein